MRWNRCILPYIAYTYSMHPHVPTGGSSTSGMDGKSKVWKQLEAGSGEDPPNFKMGHPFNRGYSAGKMLSYDFM